MAYTDLRRIGSGGFGEVYQCQSTTDGKKYAKKVLSNPADLDARKRFEKEVAMLAKLEHKNIIKVVETGFDEIPPYFVTPLYKDSLRAHVSQLIGDQTRIQKVFGAVLDGMEYAHTQNVIHRDLKPENILLNNDDDVVITDFGLGRMLDSKSSRVSKPGQQFGSQFYVAPEQIDNFLDADYKSDIYSLGAILYELQTGRMLSRDLSSCPARIRVLVEICTEQSPERRFNSVAELKSAWSNVMNQEILENEAQRVQEILRDVEDGFQLAEYELEELAILLMKQDNANGTHECFMKLDAVQVAQMFILKPEYSRKFLQMYIEEATTGSWSWKYTNQIGAFCEKLFDLIGDFQDKALLLRCTMEIGINYNHYAVIERFKKMFLKTSDSSLLLAFGIALAESTLRIKTAAYGKLWDSPEFSMKNRRLFESSILGDEAEQYDGSGVEHCWKLTVQRANDPRVWELAKLVNKVSLTSRTVVLSVISGESGRFTEFDLEKLRDVWQAANSQKVIIVVQEN